MHSFPVEEYVVYAVTTVPYWGNRVSETIMYRNAHGNRKCEQVNSIPERKFILCHVERLF